jgi:C1A family cysteine protease
VFRDNIKHIDAMNKKAKEEGIDTVYGLNKFSDLSQEEFRKAMLMPKFDTANQCKWPDSKLATVSDTMLKAAPTSWDWRTQSPNPVTGVKNQQDCGSCWAFSTSGNIEGQWRLANNPLIELSEQQLVDCSTMCVPNSPDLCDAGCNGGLPWLAMEDVINWGNLTTENSYPYTAETDSCSMGPRQDAGAKISDWKAAPVNLASIEAYLVSQGPLSITINADPLMSYNRGIITSRIAGNCPSSGSDHAVLLVGYDTGSSVDPVTNVPKPVHYWIVKNSWGDSWGNFFSF